MSAKRLFQPKPGEKLMMALHRHPITFLKYILIFIVLAGVPTFALAFVWGADGITVANPLGRVAIVLLGAAYYLGIWLAFFTQFVDHYLDISIVTDHRVIDIDQKGLFNRAVAELNLARIQDVTSEVKGFIPTVFNYGRVTIQTASESEHFIFENIHRPHAVRQRILDLAQGDRKHEAKEMLGEKISGVDVT